MVRGEEADQVDGVVRIEEAATHSIEGVVGYAPGAEQESGEWTGYFDASLRNMFGSGRELAVSWAKVQGDEFNFHVSFRERWLFGSQLSVAGKFDQVVQDIRKPMLAVGVLQNPPTHLASSALESSIAPGF